MKKNKLNRFDTIPELKMYCNAVQISYPMLLGLNSILFLLSLFILFKKFNRSIKNFCIGTNILLLLTCILIIFLSLYYKKIKGLYEQVKNNDNVNNELKSKFNVGPTIIIVCINILIYCYINFISKFKNKQNHQLYKELINLIFKHI